MIQLQLPETASTAPRTLPAAGGGGRSEEPPDDAPVVPDPLSSEGLGSLHRGEQVVYHELTGLPRSAEEIAREAGQLLVATRRHLRGLEEAGLAINTESGWLRR